MDKTNHLNIYCFSGTGNSRYVARQMIHTAQQQGFTTSEISLDNSTNLKDAPQQPGQLTGIVFPTHGFTSPWQVIKCALKIKKGDGAVTFCATTRGQLKFGRLFLPGISASAPFLIAFILWLKGYRVLGCRSIDMPSNWYSLHPMQSKQSHAAIIERSGNNIDTFIGNMLKGRRVWFSRNIIIEFLWGILLSPISIAYLFVGRFFLAKLFFANENCNGCGICAKHCPVQAIKITGRKKILPYWKYNCESCMRCAAVCPKQAVEAGHSWGVMLYFITTIPAGTLLLKYSGVLHSSLPEMQIYWLHRLLDVLYFYPAIFLSYFIFMLLNRIPLVKRLFSYSTLTRLPFWGRYHAVDFKPKKP